MKKCNILCRYPDSVPAIRDLAATLVSTDQYGVVVASLRQQLQRRLLHAAVSTGKIITVYISILKVAPLRVLLLPLAPNFWNFAGAAAARPLCDHRRQRGRAHQGVPKEPQGHAAVHHRGPHQRHGQRPVCSSARFAAWNELIIDEN